MPLMNAVTKVGGEALKMASGAAGAVANSGVVNRTTVGAVVGCGATLAVVVATPVIILPALGFGAGGVAAGSAAALAQSAIGNVAAGGVFASLQSAGAVGALSWMTTGVATAAGTAAGASAGAVSRWRRVSPEKNCNNHDSQARFNIVGNGRVIMATIRCGFILG